MSDLADMIRALMESGLSADEAARTAAEALKGKQQITKREPMSLDQRGDGRVPVDYGSETPEQAYARWEEQERADPQGVFSGGLSAGGVFGGSPVATDSYDPEAVRRTVDLHNAVNAQQVQLKTLEVLQGMQAQLQGRQEAPQLEEPPQRKSSFTRRLGRKRTRR